MVSNTFWCSPLLGKIPILINQISDGLVPPTSWVWLPSRNRGKWRFRFGFPEPTTVYIVLVVTIASWKGRRTQNLYYTHIITVYNMYRYFRYLFNTTCIYRYFYFNDHTNDNTIERNTGSTDKVFACYQPCEVGNVVVNTWHSQLFKMDGLCNG